MPRNNWQVQIHIPRLASDLTHSHLRPSRHLVLQGRPPPLLERDARGRRLVALAPSRTLILDARGRERVLIVGSNGEGAGIKGLR
jgi:hypothetical protein